MIKKLICLIIVISFTSYVKTYSQQGKVDTTFNTLDDGLNGDGFDKTVETLSMQADENLIVGGNFLSLNGTPLSYLTRLQPDGTIDQSFNTGTGFNGIIYKTYIQSDGKLLVGGNFTSYNGSTVGRLVRLNTDGSQDTTFDTSIGASSIVYDIAQQSDGKIIIVGNFAKYKNLSLSRIARLMPNGTLDTSFSTGIGAASNISTVKILSNHKILIGGNFIAFNGTPANRITLLNQDGSVDTNFNIGTGFNGNVNAIEVQPDQKIIVGGVFTTYNEVAANRIIRLSEDGTPDINFLSGTGIDNGIVQVIKTDPYGNIMVGGSFTGFYNGVDVNRICYLNQNGTIKTDFDIGQGPGSVAVLALETDSEGAWFIGGSFSVFDGTNQGRLAKVNSEGEHDISYLSAGVGFDNSVLKVISLEDNKSMVFGNFSKFNGGFAPKIARLLNDGMLDSDFNLGKSGANKVIRTAVLQEEDGKIICGGDFTKYNDVACNRIVRILPDGAIDPSFNSGSGFAGSIYAMAIQSTGKIIVAGSISSYNGITAPGRIIRLMPDGSRDNTFNVGSGADGVIEVIVVQRDGKILVGGRFIKFNGITSPHLVRLNANGDFDSSFLIGDDGFDKNVYALALQSDQRIIVGGNFSSFNRTAQKRILRLNTNGSLDATFDSGTGFSNGEVRSILIQPDDRILIGGTFSGTYKNRASLRLIRLLKTGSYDVSFVAPLNNKLLTMSFTADFKLLIGGNFNSVSETSKHRIARLKLCLDSTIWNGISWSKGEPSGGKEVFFKENFESLTTTNICSCTIDEGKTVTLLSENTLGIEFSYLGSGTLILEDSASLYQSDDDMINTGIVHLKRKTKPVTRYDFTYWSSPVENQTLGNLSPNTLIDKYTSFNGMTDSWVYEQRSSTMVVGKGYAIRAPQEFSITKRDIFEATFKGVPNNGKVEVNLEPDNTFNLLGNPYPSAIDADLFLTKNIYKTKGAIHLWTHNTPVTDHKYTADDYAVYNLLGGVGTRATSSGVNNTEPDGTIAAGQSFFIQSKGVATVQFTNEMRIKGRNSSFFKPGKISKSSKQTSVEKNRIWLNLQNDEGIFKQILVGYLEGASYSFDENYDAECLNGNKYVNFYSIVENKELVIQGRALPFVETDSISLGYTTTIEGNFNFSIDHQDGIFDEFDIFIEDVALEKIHNLKASPYIFNSKEGTFNTRFLLKFIDKTLKVKDFDLVKENVFVAVKNKMITINSLNGNIKELSIFDISGKMIYTKSKVNLAEFQVLNLKSATQILLVKVTLESGRQVIKKILF